MLFDLGAVLFGDRVAPAPTRRRAASQAVRDRHRLTVVLGALPLAATPWQSIWIMGIAMGGSGALYTLLTSDLLGRMPAGSVSFAGGVMACAYPARSLAPERDTLVDDGDACRSRR